ncbi:MAG: MBL fold metallo-hydrolase [Rhodospirillaceae bacterium]|nr:MBL fold metallo-hydrolase [Rhodospirillaceae bacterium]
MRKLLAGWLAVVVAGTASAQQQDFSKVELAVVPVARNIYMIAGGAGGNIGMCVGDDGVVLIDDMFAPLADKIVAAVKTVTDKPIKILLNTHFHGDHTGANENFAKLGVTLVAHDNTYTRLSTPQTGAFSGKTSPPQPEGMWPHVTFADAMTVHMCGYTVKATRVAPAHTDTDIAIHFVEADVYHLGDTYFNEAYPFFDLSAGGSIDGMIAAMDTFIAKSSAATKIIPGHGKLSNKAEMTAYRDMMVTVRDRIQKAINDGKDLPAIAALKLTADLDAKWGRGFMNAEFVTRIVYESLKKK